METTLTYEKILKLFEETDKRRKESDKRIEESNRRFDERLRKEAEEREKREIILEERLRKETAEREKERLKSKKEFDKKIGNLTGVLGNFVEGMIEPKLLEMFHERGIYITEIMKNVQIHNKETLQKEAEIDLLLVNDIYSVAVEIKTTLTSEHVKEHLVRLDRLKNNPIRSIKGTNLLGAVAGMRVEGNADIFAVKKGLYVLKQKGEIVEISNDKSFRHKEWKVNG
ncbi:MAG: hypothetical protein DRJ05_15400 [Bacteroidetes bacterium]|nr:MAG: hypothetical protein DRJ05_15400 [Bacteroidota bacterium]